MEVRKIREIGGALGANVCLVVIIVIFYFDSRLMVDINYCYLVAFSL